MMNQLPEIWANRVNASGLCSTIPFRMFWDEETKEYWDAKNEIEVHSDEVGFAVMDMFVVTFASGNEDEVLAWTRGVEAAMHILRSWTTLPDGEMTI